MKDNICMFCNFKGKIKKENFLSLQINNQGNRILVPKVKSYVCTNQDCNQTWISLPQEKYIIKELKNE